MTSKRKLTLFSLFLAGSLFMASCESEPSQSSEQEVTAQEEVAGTDEVNEEQRENIKMIFYSIPSPVEMASLIQESGSTYDESLMNSTDNAKKYSSLRAQAINLGVYGADISYAGMFEQNQTTVNYMSSIQNLSNSLGLSDIMNNQLIDRISANKENKDSLLNIAAETYWTFNGYLKEDDREDIASLVIAGGWIEGLHLALSHCETNEGLLATRVAEQKLSLSNLVALMEQNASDKTADVTADLARINAVFDQVNITRTPGENKKNEDGVLELGSTNDVEMSAETMAELKSVVAEIRGNYIQ